MAPAISPRHRQARAAALSRPRSRECRPWSPCRRPRPCRSACRPAQGRLRRREDRRRSGTPRRSLRRSGRARRVASALPGRGWRRHGSRSAAARRSSSPARSRPRASCSRCARPSAKRPSAARSSIWPPTMPPRPEARASASTSSTRTAGLGWVSGRDRMSKAKVSRPSPARIAVASSKALCDGRPPAAQLVVVHGRQVVMHQRIAVHAFERRARHQGVLRAAPRTGPRSRPPGTAGTACRRRGSHSAWPPAAARGRPSSSASGSVASSRSSSASMSFAT